MKKNLSHFKNMKFHIHTFGCQMNENDSERIAGILSNEGAKIAPTPEESDLIIINTCAVREKAEEKLYSYIGRMSSFKQRKKVLIGVVGCVAQLYRSELLEKRPIIDFILGPDNYSQLPHIISSTHQEKFISTEWQREWQEIPHELILRESPISAYVTIMEGCNNFCSYCVVPFTRGREKYRPLQNILKEVKYLTHRGYKEIQFLGQNVNSYIDPETGKDFSHLLRDANQMDGIEWIRFITSHPKNFTKDIGLAMQELEKVCHQLHLPLQSGSSPVLERMNRGYTVERYLEIISFLRNLMPEVHFSTDIIVGFPEETEEEFQETLKILEEIRFTNVFSFRYSPRPFASASKKRDSVPFEDKKRRLIELQKRQKKIQLDSNKSLIGRVLKVFCLGISKKNSNVFAGRNEGYQVINFKSPRDPSGLFVNVQITGCGPYNLHGLEVI